MIEWLGHMDQHGMSAGDDQGEEREIVGRGREQVRVEVTFHVVHPDERDAEGVGHGLPEIQPHQQGSDESGAVGRGDAVQVFTCATRLRQCFLHHFQDHALMGAGGQFGDHPAVFRMDELRRDHVREDGAVPHDRGGGLIAGRLNTENCHAKKVRKQALKNNSDIRYLNSDI